MTYSKALLHYFHLAKHRGEFRGEDVVVARVGVTGREVLELYMQYRNQQIAAMRFKALGSPALIAAAEYVCEYLEGKTCADALLLSHQQILQALELGTLHIHIAAMMVDAIKGCCQQDETKQ